MKRKLCAGLLALALGLGLTACGDQAGENTDLPKPSTEVPQVSGGMTAGVQTVTKAGYADDFTIEVEVDEKSIVDVRVVKTNDTKNLGQVAQYMLAKKVVELQSTNIDCMSGATISSRAFLGAVREALKAAGAGDDMFATDYTTQKLTGNVEHFEADIIVVGGGLAGVVSAMTAVEQGAKVLLIEQNSFLGGTSMHSGGNLAQAGSATQPSSSATADTFYEWLVENAEDAGFRPEMARVMADNSAPAYDNLIRWGMKISEMVPLGDAPVAAYYSRQAAGEFSSKGWFLFDALSGTIDSMIEAGNLAIRYNTKATGLLTNEQGAVVGVTTAQAGDLTANAVILASGGFVDNTDMMGKIYTNYASGTCGTDTGEMTAAALELGADSYRMEATRLEGGTLPVMGTLGERSQYECAVTMPGFVFLDKNGTRIAAGDSNAKDIWLNAEDNVVYILMDQAMVDQGSILKLGGAYDSCMDTDNSAFNKLLAAGNCIWSAGTAKELAEKAGMSPSVLEDTIKTYNDFCAAGVDEAFGRKAESLIPLEGQLYLIKTIGNSKGTSGGLVANEKMQVLSEGKPIVGLYASGEILGTIASCGRLFMGGALILGTSFGHVAAVNAAEYALK